ncbi:MAG: hypothetical protein RL499_824, partial [Actinomycetota bacterium]
MPGLEGARRRGHHARSIPRLVAAEKPLRVLIAGASGLIGTELQRQLRAEGHTVLTLVRRTPRS